MDGVSGDADDFGLGWGYSKTISKLDDDDDDDEWQGAVSIFCGRQCTKYFIYQSFRYSIQLILFKQCVIFFPV